MRGEEKRVSVYTKVYIHFPLLRIRLAMESRIQNPERISNILLKPLRVCVKFIFPIYIYIYKRKRRRERWHRRYDPPGNQSETWKDISQSWNSGGEGRLPPLSPLSRSFIGFAVLYLVFFFFFISLWILIYYSLYRCKGQRHQSYDREGERGNISVYIYI